MNTTTNATANEAYGAARVRVQSRLIQLQDLLNAHGKNQKGTPESWSHLGDLNHVAEILNEAIGFLGGAKETRA